MHAKKFLSILSILVLTAALFLSVPSQAAETEAVPSPTAIPSPAPSDGLEIPDVPADLSATETPSAGESIPHTPPIPEPEPEPEIASEMIGNSLCTIVEQPISIMVPLRATGEALGYTVTWYGEDKRITLEDDHHRAILHLDDPDFMVTTTVPGMVGSESHSMVVAPYCVNGVTYVSLGLFQVLEQGVQEQRDFSLQDGLLEGAGVPVMVPLRAVGEALGCSVGWEQKTQTITIMNRELLTVWFKPGNMSAEAAQGNPEGETAVPGTFVYDLSVAPYCIQGTTYVPITLFMDLLACNADYQLQGSQLTITTTYSQ